MDPRLRKSDSADQQFSEQVVLWLNEVATSINESDKVANLCKVKEVLINTDSSLIDEHLDNMLQFGTDRSTETRKTIAGFLEEVGEKRPLTIPKVVPVLLMLVEDKVPVVAKRAIRAAIRILKAALKWIANAPNMTPDMEKTWNNLSTLKVQIINMIDSDNDGIRTQAVKFLEGVVLLHSYADPDLPKKNDDFSLDDIPLTLKIARRRNLEKEANDVMDLLIKFHGSPHISSVNLMTCMGSLALIAKSRPQFMQAVIEAMQKLQNDLPPTLSDSQVISVQKQLRLTLFGLMKHPSSAEFAPSIAKLLTQLGVKQQEIMKVYPKLEDIKRVKKRHHDNVNSSASKKIKTDATPLLPPLEEPDPLVPVKLPELIELSESFIAERLSLEIATELVLDSMIWVPDEMSPIFQREYHPTMTTDVVIQRQVIAKLLAAQIKQAKAKKTKKDSKEDDIVMEELIKNPSISVAEAKREKKREKDREKEREAKASLEAHEKSRAKNRTVKLNEVTKPLFKDAKEKIMLLTVSRILTAEKTAIIGGVSTVRAKILTTLAASFNANVKEMILRHITEDIRSRIDLALGWLYEEYALLQGFQRRTNLPLKPQESPHHAYNYLLCTLVSAVEKIQGKDRDTLLSRLYLEAPLITEDAVETLKVISSEENRGLVPLELLKEMVIRRPPKHLIFVNVLLCHTGHENGKIRDAAIQMVVDLYCRSELTKLIEDYAVMYLGFLKLPNPPEIVFGQDRGRLQIDKNWTESTVRACLGLYLALITEKEELIHELTRVYTSMSPDVKRIVLRLVEAPVRKLGMASPQLLSLVEACPKGSETLVTRIIHILTEKAPPSAELVSRVRELYQTRVSDVRFLIPVLNGLTKKEVIAALPKLIKLNPVVVKEVFNRLLGTHNADGSGPHTSPLTPAELLIALHSIDSSKAELKTVMKATSLCFSEKEVYTQETVAVVMQHLMEMTPLPTLLMRTVIQSLTLYPRLSGFVMNILQRLILRQVWKQPKVWEGFVKCCERTQPQSFSVILQLPPVQLAEALKMAPALKEPLVAHVESFSDNQKAHVAPSIMEVLKGKVPFQSSCDDVYIKHEIITPAEFPIEPKTEMLDMDEPAPPGLD